MKKDNPLMAGLAQFDRKAAPSPSPEPPPKAPTTNKTPSRQGAVQIAAFFPEEVSPWRLSSSRTGARTEPPRQCGQ
jgi:hypothetical protein